MAISVTTDLTDITLCNTTTDAGTFYRLAGTSSGNPAADADAQLQGNGCVANKMGATTGADVGGHFNHTTTFDLSGKHLYHWRQIVTAGNMLTKPNRGVCLGLTNTSTTSTTAWSTTNYKLWFLDGSDTVPSAKGWDCYVIDPGGTPDASAGTLTLASVKNVGFICRQNSGVTTTVSNQFVDAVRAGTGVTATASSGGDTITFNSIYSVDSSSTNAWGVLRQSNGVYYGAGKITVGATGQTNTCLFKDTSQVLIWRDFPVSATFYEVLLKGASGQVTTFQLGDKDGSDNVSNGCIIRAQGAAVWTLTCEANSGAKIYGSAISAMRAATLSSTSELRGSSFSGCGSIDVNGATIVGCTFNGHTATQLTATTGEVANITGNSFTSGGTGHAVDLGTVSSSTTITWDNSASGYAATNGSTGNETILVNVAASQTLTINVASGATIPTYRNTGSGSVSVVAGQVTLTVKVVDVVTGAPIENARVYVTAASGGGLGLGTVIIDKLLTNASGEVTDTRSYASDQPITGVARKASSGALYKNAPIAGTVDNATGLSLTVQMIPDE